jgi:DNA-nicking Smr family endonuclease
MADVPNIEAGMPTVEQEARQILISELKQAKNSGLSAVKVIHGYGSAGKGGALRGALRFTPSWQKDS